MDGFIGVGAAIAIHLRRSFGYWLLWILVLSCLLPLGLATYDLLGTDSIFQELATSASMRALIGLPYNLANAEGFAWWTSGSLTAWLAAIMTALGLIRATRAEEETGRLELIRAGAIGRHAPLAGALLISSSAAIILGAINVASLTILGCPLNGSLAAGASIAATGIMFAGIAAVTSQTNGSSRAAITNCLGAIFGGLYVIRAAIDVTYQNEQAIMWLVPLEWTNLARPFAGERWWVFCLPIGLGLLTMIIAFFLESSRDLGDSLHDSVSEVPDTSFKFWTLFRLARRLYADSVIDWTVGVLIVAIVLGSFSTQVQIAIEQFPQLATTISQLGGAGSLEESYYQTVLLAVIALITLAATSFLNSLNDEQSSRRSELLFACGASRVQLFASRLVLTFCFTTVLALAAGFVMPAWRVWETKDWLLLTDYVQASFALLPGLWLMIGICAAIIGLAPMLYPFAWLITAWILFCSWLAGLLALPDLIVNAQPFSYLTKLPAADFDWLPWISQTLIALALIVIGAIGYHKREISKL